VSGADQSATEIKDRIEIDGAKRRDPSNQAHLMKMTATKR
jgi:hypothetical protein